MNKYLCLPCGYIYNDSINQSENETKKTLKFDDLPMNWVCPDCGSLKYDFEKLEEKNEKS